MLDQIGNDLSGGKAKGHNVTTTLNVELTKAAYKALGNNKGAVIAMEPATGKILAMVSNPSFDANAVNTDYDEWITYDSAADSVLLNRGNARAISTWFNIQDNYCSCIYKAESE